MNLFKPDSPNLKRECVLQTLEERLLNLLTERECHSERASVYNAWINLGIKLALNEVKNLQNLEKDTRDV